MTSPHQICHTAPPSMSSEEEDHTASSSDYGTPTALSFNGQHPTTTTRHKKKRSSNQLFNSVFPSSADRKRIRQAFKESENQARQIIHDLVPDIGLEVEEAVVYALRQEEHFKLDQQRQADMYLEQEEAETLALAMASLRLAEVPCPICIDGDLVPQHPPGVVLFSCDSCGLALRDARFPSRADVRKQLAVVMAKHATNGCTISRPVLKSDNHGGLQLDCQACGATDQVFVGGAQDNHEELTAATTNSPRRGR
jgi:hypothetical protein